jgi:hypothetical protein
VAAKTSCERGVVYEGRGRARVSERYRPFEQPDTRTHVTYMQLNVDAHKACTSRLQPASCD